MNQLCARRIVPPKLFEHQGVADVGHPRAAILLGKENTRKPQFRQFPNDLRRERLSLGELLHDLLDRLLSLAQLKIDPLIPRRPSSP